MHREEWMPHRYAYPLAAALFAAGAPLGYLFLRAALSPAEATAEWARREIAQDPVLYGYLTVATLVVFVALGALLGRRNDVLEETSATDPLTGLWNRRHFGTRLSEEVGRATRQQTPLALLMVDLDGLKAFNDRWGHESGDGALSAVARAIRETCRRSDVPARIGGDEFAILAPAMDAVDGLELAERLRQRLESLGASRLVTVSVGVADLARAAEVGPTALMEAADAALYRAKASGRDCVVLADFCAQSGAPSRRAPTQAPVAQVA
jgi:diguanylate cyclase (GGDEF)-like protein